MQMIMTGDPDPNLAEGEGFRLCEELGLVVEQRGTPAVANPIYREVLARQMSYGTQAAIPEPEWRWEKADRTLDMDALMEAFPHLLVQAFLQRVLNGEGATDGAGNNAGGVCDSKLQYSNRQGGRFEYEHAAGRGRMNVKLVRDYNKPEEVIEEGLEQIGRYRDRLGEIPGVPGDIRPAGRGVQETLGRTAWPGSSGWGDGGEVLKTGWTISLVLFVAICIKPRCFPGGSPRKILSHSDGFCGCTPFPCRPSGGICPQPPLQYTAWRRCPIRW
jgi:hypothetical protein